MQFHSTHQSLVSWSGDCLALGLFEGSFTSASFPTDLTTLDQTCSGALTELLQDAEFKGSSGSSAIVRVGRDTPIRKLIVVGLGKPETLTIDDLRRAAAIAARLANQARCKTLGLALPTDAYPEATTIQAAVEGIILSLYQDIRFKSESDVKTTLEEVFILGVGEQPAAIQTAQALCEGVILARQLVAAPPNTMTPITMAETAQQLAQNYGLNLEILEQADCEKLGMGAFLGVARASELPPKFLHLTYKPTGEPRKKLAIVGKGLTFDSGGLNLKVGASSIEMMKTDMGGAAATLGAAKAIALLKPDVEVHFISAVTEDMISGRALHPGDILTASNGKTIEVNNTDAEGRLTLADALVFAEKLGVDAIVDLATLTGACIIALGDNIAGLWSKQDELAAQILQASQATGEKVWRMPMEEKYFESLKSPIADMKNTGSRAGGAISASLFLQQFVKETPWAHLDVAGPVWTDKEDGYNPVGATGYGVRLLANWVMA